MPEDPNAPALPQVNDAYWFSYSKDLKNNAFKSRDDAAAKLQTLVTWLWGIYTAGAAVGFALAGKGLSFWPKFWIAAASGALIVVYWCTVWVQIPKLVAFAPNSVEEIEEAYNKGLLVKHHRLLVTLTLSVVAAVLVAISLMVASVAKEERPQPPTMAAAVKTIEGKRFLSLTAMVPPKTETVTVTIKPKKSETATVPPGKKEVPPPKSKVKPGIPAAESRIAVYAPTEEGRVQVSIPLEGLAPPLEVTLAWTDAAKKMEMSLTQTVQTAPAAGAPEVKSAPAKKSGD